MVGGSARLLRIESTANNTQSQVQMLSKTSGGTVADWRFLSDGIQAGSFVIFGGLAGTLFLFAIVLWMLSGTLVRWMHGAEDLKRA